MLQRLRPHLGRVARAVLLLQEAYQHHVRVGVLGIGLQSLVQARFRSSEISGHDKRLAQKSQILGGGLDGRRLPKNFHGLCGLSLVVEVVKAQLDARLCIFWIERNDLFLHGQSLVELPKEHEIRSQRR